MTHEEEKERAIGTTFLLRLVIVHRRQVCWLTRLMHWIFLFYSGLFLTERLTEVVRHGTRWFDVLQVLLFSGVFAISIRGIWLRTKDLKRFTAADKIFMEFLNTGTGNAEQLQGATQTALR
jgi:hypothetical protein